MKEVGILNPIRSWNERAFAQLKMTGGVQNAPTLLFSSEMMLEKMQMQLFSNW